MSHIKGRSSSCSLSPCSRQGNQRSNSWSFPRSSDKYKCYVECKNLKVPSFGLSKQGPLCVLCLRDSDNSAIIDCEGRCGHTFHTDCIGILLKHVILTNPSLGVNLNLSKCVDCNYKRMRCFQCCKLADNKPDNDIVRCSIKSCLRYYHSRCLKDGIYRKYCTISYAKKDKSVTCPSHTCHSCQLENPFNVKQAESYVRCVMCPTSFHRGEWCIPAGSKEINSSYIVCPQHLNEGGNFYKWKPPFMDCIKDGLVDFGENCHVRPYSLDLRDLWIVDQSEIKNEARPTNVTWCFKCSKGEQLFCCVKCPASFHLQCAKISKVPENYVCQECDLAKFPRYGQVLWVKCGGFRWWPAQVIHPRNALEALRSPPNEGQFLVHFFGTNDFFWTNKTHSFAFDEGDEVDNDEFPSKGKKFDFLRSKRIEDKYRSGLKHAGKTYIHRSKRWLKLVEGGEMPEKYGKIKSNFGSVRSVTKLNEINKCECKRAYDGKCKDFCGPNSNCTNVARKCECNPHHCHHGVNCLNQRIMSQKYPKQDVFLTTDRGWGLRILNSETKGTLINEYVGEVISESVANRRLEESNNNNVTNFYMVKLDRGRIIDATQKSNISRFINHSCSPNLTMETWNVNGHNRVGLFALINIAAGEELTFNYNSSSCLPSEYHLACRCGSGKCSGYIGVPPNVAVNMDIQGLKCIVCRELNCDIRCSLEQCQREFHQACVAGDQWDPWVCPSHFCDECSKSAVATCVLCVVSYCASHLSDRVMRRLESGAYMCSKHAARGGTEFPD